MPWVALLGDLGVSITPADPWAAGRPLGAWVPQAFGYGVWGYPPSGNEAPARRSCVGEWGGGHVLGALQLLPS